MCKKDDTDAFSTRSAVYLTTTSIVFVFSYTLFVISIYEACVVPHNLSYIARSFTPSYSVKYVKTP